MYNFENENTYNLYSLNFFWRALKKVLFVVIASNIVFLSIYADLLVWVLWLYTVNLQLQLDH